MVTKTLPELDLELSRSGTNAYYCDFCPHTGNRPNYAASIMFRREMNARWMQFV